MEKLVYLHLAIIQSNIFYFYKLKSLFIAEIFNLEKRFNKSLNFSVCYYTLLSKLSA